MMHLKLRKFATDQDGVVTVDWVVIAGFAISIALSVATALAPGLEERGTEMFTPASISTSF